MNTIGIIGAGASGIMAALEAAANGACVTLFEKKDSVGKKILVTGNGRCNFTNMNMSSEYYYCDDVSFVDEVLSTFGNNELISFFKRLGLLIKDKNGYVYPACEQAASLLDILKIALKQENVTIITNCNITEIKPENKGFTLKSSDGTTYAFDKVILSAGGRSSLSKGERANGYDILRKLGIKYTRLFPALTQIKCEGIDFKNVFGVRQDCTVTMYVNDDPLMKQFGEVLFTEQGISGIVSFQESHLAAQSVYEGKTVYAELDLLPDISEEALLEFVIAKRLIYPDITLEEFFTGFLNKKLNLELLKTCGLNTSMTINELNEKDLSGFLSMLKKLRLNVTGTEDFDKSQVTGGGVSLADITEDFEVKACPGLYITGELLNVDGLCGGYNLQWAFSSGYIAGIKASKR